MKLIYFFLIAIIASDFTCYAAGGPPLPVFVGIKDGKTISKKEPVETSIWQVEVQKDDQGKYKTRATVFAIGDPVHETLTLTSLINVGKAEKDSRRDDPKVINYIRGVFWNDDPCAQLFAENDDELLRPSFGMVWYHDFMEAKEIKGPTRDFGKLYCPLLGMSHFGEFQFLHAMADGNGIKPDETIKRILAWASVMYRIGNKSLSPSVPLDNDPIAQTFVDQVPTNLRKPIALFRAQDDDQTRERAIGSLLHLIQDSYAHGHVKRIKAEAGKDGDILQFLSYTNQNEKKHAHDDSWGKGSNDLEKTLAIPGAPQALMVSKNLLEFIKKGSSWDEVEQYLKTGPLRIAKEAKPSDAGEEYK